MCCPVSVLFSNLQSVKKYTTIVEIIFYSNIRNLDDIISTCTFKVELVILLHCTTTTYIIWVEIVSYA